MTERKGQEFSYLFLGRNGNQHLNNYANGRSFYLALFSLKNLRIVCIPYSLIDTNTRLRYC